MQPLPVDANTNRALKFSKYSCLCTTLNFSVYFSNNLNFFFLPLYKYCFVFLTHVGGGGGGGGVVTSVFPILRFRYLLFGFVTSFVLAYGVSGVDHLGCGGR